MIGTSKFSYLRHFGSTNYPYSSTRDLSLWHGQERGSNLRVAKTYTTSVPYPLHQHTHQHIGPCFARRSRDNCHKYPESWNFNQHNLAQSVEELAQTAHHHSTMSHHLKQKTVPNGLIAGLETFETQFRPHGYTPLIEEGLHHFIYTSMQLNLLEMQNHYKISIQSLTLRIACLHSLLNEDQLQKVQLYLEAYLRRHFDADGVQSVLQRVRSASYGTDSMVIFSPLEMPIKIDSPSLIPTNFSVTQVRPVTICTNLLGQEDQGSPDSIQLGT